MSTKIFNTYVYDGPIDEVKLILKEFSDNLDARRKEFLKRMFEGNVKYHVQELLIKSKGDVKQLEILSDEKPINFIFSPEEFRSEYRENPEQIVIFYDTENTPLKGKPLIQLFLVDNSEIEKAIKSNSKFSEFDYTNATDMSDLKRSEVNLRRKVWDGIMKKSSIPSEAGTSYEIYDIFQDKAVNKDDFENTLKIVAQDIYKKSVTSGLKKIVEKIETSIRMGTYKKNLEASMSEEEKLEQSQSVSEVMDMIRAVEADMKNKVPLDDAEQKKMDSVLALSKNLTSKISNVATQSLLERLNIVEELTIKRNAEYEKRMIEYGLKVQDKKPKVRL